MPLTVKGASGQTVDLEEWQNSSGTVLAKVTQGGAAQFAFHNYGPITTSPSFDASLYNTFRFALGANISSSTLSNATAGEVLYFVICQGSTAHTFTWPGKVKGGGTVGSTINTCSSQSFVWDSVNMNAYALGPIQPNE